jgi:hypothetical protein
MGNVDARRQHVRAAAVATLVAAVALQGVAAASSIHCLGSMRNPGCETALDHVPWPSGSQPTFSVECEGCPGPNDAGIGCTQVKPDPARFAVIVGSRFYRETTPPRYFEETGRCGNEILYRYKGPLEPGMRHGISFGVSEPPMATLQFEVAAAPPEVVDAAGSCTYEDAREDAHLVDAKAGAPAPANGDGCSCSVGTRSRGGASSASTLISASAVVLIVLRAWRRRARYNRHGDHPAPRRA